MAEAFGCDLCGSLQSGKPIATHDMRGTDPDRPEMLVKEAWCNDCMGSFADWKADRIMLAEHRRIEQRGEHPDTGPDRYS